MELWEEKLGVRKAFEGNAATEWGTAHEAEALRRYVAITGHVVTGMGFQVRARGLRAADATMCGYMVVRQGQRQTGG